MLHYTAVVVIVIIDYIILCISSCSCISSFSVETLPSDLLENKLTKIGVKKKKKEIYIYKLMKKLYKILIVLKVKKFYFIFMMHFHILCKPVTRGKK